MCQGEKTKPVSFKQRVAKCAMDNAQAFKDKFVDYEYCVCSNAFPGKVKVVKALPGNYLHLVGVNTSISADAFSKNV